MLLSTDAQLFGFSNNILSNFMVSDGPSSQRKRPREQSSHADEERPRTAKRHKRHSSPRAGYYPPRFWDTLSKVYLTRGALKEFDRRSKQTGPLPVTKPKAPSSTRLLRSNLHYLRQVAREGGPDLTSLRGVSLYRLLFNRIVEFADS